MRCRWSWRRCARPASVPCAAAHGVGACGCALVAVTWTGAVAAVVTFLYFVAMGPAVALSVPRWLGTHLSPSVLGLLLRLGWLVGLLVCSRDGSCSSGSDRCNGCSEVGDCSCLLLICGDQGFNCGVTGDGGICQVVKGVDHLLADVVGDSGIGAEGSVRRG